MELSIIIVSYNTKALTLEALDSVYRETKDIDFEVIVLDNDSRDGSAEAIAERFPQVNLIHSLENHGFGQGNNIAANYAKGQYLLLLNPDTIVLDNAIGRLLHFAKENPQAKIWGGKTLFPDRSLNTANCWGRPTLKSLTIKALGVSTVARMLPGRIRKYLGDPETYPGWMRDSDKQVDIVSGCFLMMTREFWDELKGFDAAFFMYGEEADLCLRAGQAGAKPMIHHKSTIVHYVGASQARGNRWIQLMQSRKRLIDRHWPQYLRKLGHGLERLWIFRRYVNWSIAVRLKPDCRKEYEAFKHVWASRAEW